MTEYYENTNDVAVTFIEPSNFESYAEVRTPSYPDGMVQNKLDPDELREVADMLNEAAEELEGRMR